MEGSKYASAGSRLAFLFYAWGRINNYENLCALLAGKLSISSYVKKVQTRNRRSLATNAARLKVELQKPIKTNRDSGPWTSRYQNEYIVQRLRQRIKWSEVEITRIEKETKGIRRMLRRYPKLSGLF